VPFVNVGVLRFAKGGGIERKNQALHANRPHGVQPVQGVGDVVGGIQIALLWQTRPLSSLHVT
jgi:hypothetical protein